MNPKYGLIGLLGALAMVGVLAASAPAGPMPAHDRRGPDYPHAPKPQERKAYRERIRYRKRREWDGSRNDMSLLDKARGAVAR